MRRFAYHRATSVADALAAVRDRPDAAFLAGGTNLVDHLRLGVAAPELVVDITRLPLGETTELPDGTVRVGALVPNSDLAADPLIRGRYPVLARALLAGASGQVRNAATLGGNLLQRTRCGYFRDPAMPCAKREPGGGCAAIGGPGRDQALLGTSAHCVAVHPSDAALALVVADAVVRVAGADGERTVPVTDFHREPGDRPDRDTVLAPGELVTAVDLPAPPPGARSGYRKVRERASYAFALVSVAAMVAVRRGRVTHARVALGGVATVPWRARRAERVLRDAPATAETFAAAADAELAAARPNDDNAFKVPMARNTLMSVLRDLTGEGR